MMFHVGLDRCLVLLVYEMVECISLKVRKWNKGLLMEKEEKLDHIYFAM